MEQQGFSLRTLKLSQSTKHCPLKLKNWTFKIFSFKYWQQSFTNKKKKILKAHLALEAKTHANPLTAQYVT